ncbi:amidohydrolase family protein [Actinocorallia lasiicapitis]
MEFGDRSTVLPGLIDTHVHLSFGGRRDPLGVLPGLSDERLREVIRSSALRTVRAGITTVRDLGDRGYLVGEVAEESRGRPECGPLVLAAGPPLTAAGGHGHQLGGVAESLDAIRAGVRERAERGCEVVKVVAGGGVLSPGSFHRASYSRRHLRCAVEEAHRLGLPAAVHAHDPRAIADAVAVGFDTIEHGDFLTGAGVRPDRELIRRIAEAGIAVTTTLGEMPGFPAPEPIARHLPELAACTLELHAAGVRLVPGTDAGISPGKPPDVLPYAVEFLAGVGIPAVELLRMITSTAARVCGVAPARGRIMTGAVADLLVVDGDPVRDLGALREVSGVFREGVRVR